MNDWKKLYKEAEEVAENLHRNQSYGVYPYKKHLRDVVNILEEHGFVNEYIIAGWLHDSLEDCNISYREIKDNFGKDVAEMVYAVTDPKGRTREEKKAKVYEDLKAYPKAIVIKLADRIANVRNCIRTNNTEKIVKYRKEDPDFRDALRLHSQANCNLMWHSYDNVILDIEKHLGRF